MAGWTMVWKLTVMIGGEDYGDERIGGINFGY